ncbi:MAG: 23S rRNA (guanosine(2251)-2'-O)-methyltransferase RlmB [Bacilli bacterium]|nr:23S rRNA (guanosine(2251)-2'-O)-methyltransferase RlmB [Bacilli bacterium]
MYICGKNVAREYLESNERVRKVILAKNYNDNEILNLVKRKNVDTEFVDKYVLDKITKENHQGIILQVPDFEYSSLDDFMYKDDSFVVILDHIEDPHNFGAIIRTCEAAGVDGIIIPKNRSVDVTSTVIRTSVGASKYVPICQITNLTNTINELKKNGFWVVGTDMDGTSYDEIDYKGKICIIIGNEGSGIGHLVRENCDFIASIPMKGKINSLNASVAAGIIIYEAVRNRK